MRYKTSDQPLLIDEPFTTRKPAHAVFCHEDFLEKLQDTPAGKRAALLIQRLAVDPRRQHYKATAGQNRGWRRSRLGGGHGSHFYAWWAPRGASPLKGGGGFEEAPEGSVFLRDIRHHDDHSELTPQMLDEHYLHLTVKDMRHEEYGPSPWTPVQAKFAKTRSPVSILKGHPGSGKTTALWHAADLAPAESVLYITYSAELAALAQDYFDRYCPADKNYRVVTFPALMRELAGISPEILTESERRARFLAELGVSSRMLGPWADHRGSFYEELHAHMIGEALPERAGRFQACGGPRLSEKAYRERRGRWIGPAAAAAAADTVTWLARNRPNFEQTLFPELYIAWKAAEQLRQPGKWQGLAARGLLDFQVIAVDEVQDLTPLETYTLLQLVKAAGNGRGRHVNLMLAGDEAQTVRPTDFEWAWLNDLLHDQAGTPVEHKLTSNLRSPRRIAELINRVWELYGHLSKQDRPSGAGYADIEEDAAEQMIYCTSAPGPELGSLLETLADREGLAIISMEQPPPDYVPESVRRNVLSPAEAKGLDFQGVAVLGAGKKLQQISAGADRYRADSGIESLGRRLAIDELRVVLSRPTERLYWIDVNPSKEIVSGTLLFLNGGADERQVSPSIPAGVLRTLEEDQLDTEERVQRCQVDARQYLGVRPEMAWSRAQQAVTLLGRAGLPGAVEDEAARQGAFLTLAEVAFTLAVRKVNLPSELGRPDLMAEAARASAMAKRQGLAHTIREIARQKLAAPLDRLTSIAEAAGAMMQYQKELEPWVLTEMGAQLRAWMEDLEGATSQAHNTGPLLKLLPAMYELLSLPDVEERLTRLKKRCLGTLLKEKAYGPALEILRGLPERQYGQEALCYEGMGDYGAAAEAYLAAGDKKEALQCFRRAPNFERSLALLDEIEDHPAAASLRWVSEMQKLAARRPEEFAKVMTPPEKKLLESILEQGLGVSRKKAAARKAAGPKKVASPKKAAARKTVKKALKPTPRF